MFAFLHRNVPGIFCKEGAESQGSLLEAHAINMQLLRNLTHAAHATLPGCTATRIGSTKTMPTLLEDVRTVGRTRLGVGACCRRRKRAADIQLFVGKPGDAQQATDCEELCENDKRCQFYSHSSRWQDCFLCSGCNLDTKKSSGAYRSWRLTRGARKRESSRPNCTAPGRN